VPSAHSRSVVWKPLVVCPQSEVFRSLQTVLGGLSPEEPCMLAEYPRAGMVASLVERNACNVCFLDAATNGETVQWLIAELAPLLPVVALHPGNDADLILRCLRRGASEFLAEPTPEAVRGVLERLARGRNETAADAPGRLFCVVPGKPGCGASTLAVHLATQMRSGSADRVLLVDGDQLTASIAFMLKLKPEFHLQDVARDWSRMDDDLWSRLVVPACGVDILAAPEDPASRTEVSRQFAGQLCTFWRERYRTIVLDLPDVRTAADCGFLGLADVILMVTTNELAALHATGRGLRLLSGAGEQAKVRLILNRYTPATGLKREDVKTALSLSPFAVLCNDYEAIQAALLDGKPAAQSRFAASVQDLCRQLSDRPAVAKPSPSWISSLFHRK
jgi:pilus assembly protein CpaE